MTDVFQTFIDPTQQVTAIESRMRRGDLAGYRMVDVVRKLLTAGPDLRERWGNVEWIAETIGDMEAALQAARRYFMADALNPVVALKVAELICETGRVEMALDVAQSIADQRPGDPAPQFHLGFYSARLGDFAQAMVHFRAALAAKSDLTFVWQQIAALKTFTDPADPDLQAMTNLSVRLASAPTATRAPLLYALGKAYEDLGDARRAFSSYAEGSRLMSAERPWDARAFESSVDEIVRDFDRRLMNAQPPSQVASDRPMFLIGAPRSGGALLERVLTACDGVHGGGPLNVFRLSTLPLGEHRPSRLGHLCGGRVEGWIAGFLGPGLLRPTISPSSTSATASRAASSTARSTTCSWPARSASPSPRRRWPGCAAIPTTWPGRASARRCSRGARTGTGRCRTSRVTCTSSTACMRTGARCSATSCRPSTTRRWCARPRRRSTVSRATWASSPVPRALAFHDNPHPVDSASLRELRRPASQGSPWAPGVRSRPRWEPSSSRPTKASRLLRRAAGKFGARQVPDAQADGDGGQDRE